MGTLLAWGGLVAAPLLLHLLSRRKYREVQWAAMQYLLAAIKKNSRRVQIEQLILLLLRTLAVACIVLAAAKLFFENSPIAGSSHQRTHRVIVLDASYSMAYKPADRSRFESAKQLAENIVQQGTQGDGYSLVLLGAPPRVVVGNPAFEPRDFLEELKNIHLAHTGADLSATLQQVEQVITAAKTEHPRLVAREIYFLTDLGRNTWQPDLKETSADDFRARSQRLAKEARLVVLDLGQPTWENVAVTGIQLADSTLATARDATIEAEIKNFGNQSITRLPVEWYVDGRRAGQDAVDLDAAGRATVALTHHFDTPGDHSIEARLASDLLPVDNHRWLSLRVKPQLRVLCVGSGQSDGYLAPAEYLALALRPDDDRADSSDIQCDVLGESSLADADLASYDCVFLANLGQFTASEGTLLSSYVAHGGNLVWFLGEQVQLDSYNRRLCSLDTGAERALPARLTGFAPAGQYMFDPLDYQHPLLAAYRGRSDHTLQATLVTRYVKAELPPLSKARVALAYENGDPAIIEEAIGRGRSILVTTSADRSWSVMPLIGSLNELVYEMLGWVVHPAAPERNLLVGQPIGDTLHGQAVAANVQLHIPGGEQQQLRLNIDGDYSVWSFADTQLSGLYKAELPSPWGVESLSAVNVDTSESDLTAADPTELSAKLWAGVPFTHLTDWQDIAEAAADAAPRRHVLQVYLLSIAIICLLAETFLAWRFGTRGA
ncbi:MAG: VWA domain-containing protein [Planctomycetes bacterium]|nr:VWA domain-containing protein [Planctomycetota bacterium]